MYDLCRMITKGCTKEDPRVFPKVTIKRALASETTDEMAEWSLAEILIATPEALTQWDKISSVFFLGIEACELISEAQEPKIINLLQSIR